MNKLLLVCLLISFPISSFAQMLQLSDQDLIESSEGIVRGDVLSIEAKWVNNDKYIYTFTQIKVKEVFTGTNKVGDVVTIVAPGGYDPVKDIGMRVSHMAHFEHGEDVIVFLTEAKGNVDAIDYTFLKEEPGIPKQIQRINGYYQGKRKIIKNEGSNKLKVLKTNENRMIDLEDHNYSLLNQIKSSKF